MDKTEKILRKCIINLNNFRYRQISSDIDFHMDKMEKDGFDDFLLMPLSWFRKEVDMTYSAISDSLRYEFTEYTRSSINKTYDDFRKKLIDIVNKLKRERKMKESQIS